MRRSPLLLLVLFASPSAFAADVDLKPVYLQPLKHTVFVDAHGNPWFSDGDGIRDAANKLIGRPPEKGEPLLVDRAGRIWWKPIYAYGGKLTYFDEKAWKATKIAPEAIHEDSAGRVFAVTHRQVGDKAVTNTLHVFADGKWAEEGLPDRVLAHGRIQAHSRFAADPKGRTWFWLEQYREWGLTDPAAWVFDGKTWTGHAISGRKAGEAIELLLPFADDWFLVLTNSMDEQRRWQHRAFAWSPSRKADEIAKANPFPDLPLTELHFLGVDTDGVRHFRWLDRSHPDMPRWQIAPTTPPYLAVTPDRKVMKLTEEQAERAAARLAGARHPRPNFSKGDAPPTVLPFPVARVIGTDKAGRIYLENGNETVRRAWVLWPEKEKPGDVLRLSEYVAAKAEAARERGTSDGLFTDAHGLAFARPYYSHDTVVAWDGTKWTDTPIRRLPLATWSARPGPPPEHQWANFRWVGHTSGSDGRTLFVRVKTKYAPEKDGERTWGQFGGRGEEPKDDERKDDGKPFYQYEAWTHLDGAWSDAHPPAELLKAKRKELVEGFQLPHAPLGPLPVLSHGKRLWLASDWTVRAMDTDGTVYSAELPKPEAVKQPENPRLKFAPPLMLAALAKLDDKTLLLAVAGPQTKTYRVQFRGLKPIGVQVTELDPLPVPFAVLHKATDGTVLAWADDQSRGYPLLYDGVPTTNTRVDYHAVYRLREGKWETVADIARPSGISADGTLWCEPYDPNNTDADYKAGKAVLYRVSGAKAERFVWERDEPSIGFEKPAPGTATFVLPRYGLVNVEPGKDGTKPTLGARYVGPLTQLELRQPAVTATGQILFPTEWGTLFGAKGK